MLIWTISDCWQKNNGGLDNFWTRSGCFWFASLSILPDVNRSDKPGFKRSIKTLQAIDKKFGVRMQKPDPWLIFTLFMLLPFALQAEAQCDHEILFTSEHAAVVAAMNEFNPLSIAEDREYMGAIFREGNRYRYSVTAGGRHRDSLSISVAAGEWDSVAAFWHTHGSARPSNRYFSAHDTELVNRYKKPLYLGDYTGYLKRFRPGDRQISPFSARRLGLPARNGYAVGTQVNDSNRRPVKIAIRNSGLS